MKNRIVTHLGLFFNAVKNKIVKRYDKFIEDEPKPKEEVIYKIVFQLRRDFKINEQNEIVLSILNRLNSEREKDIQKLNEEIEIVTTETDFLKAKLAL